jgi:hypothetical protein
MTDGDLGLPPLGFEWTGEVRPPKKGEFFWSEIRGDVVEAIEDETGVNRFGQPTGGRRILRPVEPPPAHRGLRLVKEEKNSWTCTEPSHVFVGAGITGCVCGRWKSLAEMERDS